MSSKYPSDWQQRRKKVYQRDGYECQNCGAKGGSKGDVQIHAHHIVPISSGGTHKLSNLKTVCQDCHTAIHNQTQAPTADTSQNTTHSENTDIADNLLFGVPFRFEAIRITIGEYKDEDPFETTHQQLGYLLYAREIFKQTIADIERFAVQDEPIPNELQDRYITAKTIIQYILGKTDNIDETVLVDLINIAPPKYQMKKQSEAMDSIRNIEDLNTMYEMLQDWDQDYSPSSPENFDDFITVTSNLINLIDEQFEHLDNIIIIESNSEVTLNDSNDWKLEEISKEIEKTMSVWWNVFYSLSDRGIEQAPSDMELYKKWRESLTLIDNTIFRMKIVLFGMILGIIGGFFLGMIIDPINMFNYSIFCGILAYAATSKTVIKWAEP